MKGKTIAMTDSLRKIAQSCINSTHFFIDMFNDFNFEGAEVRCLHNGSLFVIIIFSLFLNKERHEGTSPKPIFG